MFRTRNLKFDSSSIGIFKGYNYSKLKNLNLKIFGNDGAMRTFAWAFGVPVFVLILYARDLYSGEEKRRIKLEEDNKYDEEMLEQFNNDFIKNRFLYWVLIRPLFTC